ncbi:MAG: leucine-rich repeat protein, partial [Bacteroidales bacterium]|nr:leucine-rich repeat protein [Bacteroidales bacterium]
MKKLNLLLLCGWLCTASLSAQTTWDIGSPNAEDVTATLSNDTLTIRGTGAMENWMSWWTVPWVSHRTTITTVIIEDGVTTIGNEAFSECSGLTEVNIPSSVNTIGYYAFNSCTGLTEVNIPSSVNTIGFGAFNSCTGLTSVIIPNSVTEIGELTFNNCTGLTSVIIPNSVNTIGSSAFYGCTGLTSVTIPDSVTSIAMRTFYGCTGLTSVTIPNSVNTIGSSAFYSCTGLTSLTIGNSVMSIQSEAFRGCTGLTSLTIPNSVTSIQSEAFRGCTGLKKIVIEDGTSVLILSGTGPFSAFNNVSVDTLYLGRSTFASGTSSWFGTALKNLTIGSSVTEIGDNAFSGCTGLTSVTSLAETPPTLGTTVFNNVDMTACCLYVPTSSVDLYGSAPQWSAFTCVNPDGEVHIVTFNSQGGSHVGLQLVIAPNNKVTEPAVPTFTGFTFGGWYTEPECINIWDFDSDIVTSDTTLYAKWTVSVYTVTFNSQGGSAVAEQYIYHNEQASEPIAPTSAGFIFSGWYKEPGCINIWDFDTDRVISDTTLYAKWALDPSSVDDLYDLIDLLRDSIEKLTTANEALQGDTANLNTTIAGLEGTIDDLQLTIDGLQGDTARLHADTLRLHEEIVRLELLLENCDDPDYLADLLEQILDLQTEVSDLQTDTANLNTTIAGLQDDITDLIADTLR